MAHYPIHPGPGPARAMNERADAAGPASALTHTANGRPSADHTEQRETAGSIEGSRPRS